MGIPVLRMAKGKNIIEAYLIIIILPVVDIIQVGAVDIAARVFAEIIISFGLSLKCLIAKTIGKVAMQVPVGAEFGGGTQVEAGTQALPGIQGNPVEPGPNFQLANGFVPGGYKNRPCCCIF
jgi:hypothetical protein